MRLLLSLILTAFLSLQTAGCNSMTGTVDRRLQTITVTPATATGHDTSTGQVSFTATGAFTAPPTPVSPLAVGSWLVSDTNIATVNDAGVAECKPAAMGTVIVKAVASSGSDMPGATATAVTGTAQLTCP